MDMIGHNRRPREHMSCCLARLLDHVMHIPQCVIADLAPAPFVYENGMQLYQGRVVQNQGSADARSAGASARWGV